MISIFIGPVKGKIMSKERREVTKRVKNRLMLTMAMFIACGMGLLVLLDSRHVGNMISRSGSQMGQTLIAYNQHLPGDPDPVVFVYTHYGLANMPRSGSVPTPAQVGRPAIEAYYQADLTRIYNSSFDFGDNYFYDIRYATAISDVDNDGVIDIFASLGRVSNTEPFSVEWPSESDYGSLRPNFVAYYNILLSGKNGSVINGWNLADASFSDAPVTSAVWVDKDFTTSSNELNMRDAMPDLVCMFNMSTDYYLQAYHLDLKNPAPDPHLAWVRNNNETLFEGNPDPEEYRDLEFVNATQPNNTMVLVKTWNKFIRFFACNGSFATYPENNRQFAWSSEYDFTGDGVDEIYLGTTYDSPIRLNVTVFNLVDNSTYAQDNESLGSGSINYMQDNVLATRPNPTNPSSFPIAYFSFNYRINNQRTYFACRLVLTDSYLDLQKLNFEEETAGINYLDLGFFNDDQIYDLAVQRQEGGDDMQNKDIVIYDGESLMNGEMEKLESQPAVRSFSSGQFHLIPDIGGNGQPDFLICYEGTFVVSSFETIFFYEHNVPLTVLFFLCVVGFLVGTIILIGWRRALKKATDQGLPEQLNDGVTPVQVSDQTGAVEVKKSPLRKVVMGIIILLVAITAPFIIMMRLQTIGEPLMSSNVSMIHIVTAVLGVFYAMIPVVAVLYNLTAPTYATSLYINAQAKFFTMQPGKHDYRVLVLDFGGRNKRSMVSYLSRCLFPIFLAVFLGNNIFSLAYRDKPPLTSFTGDTAMMTWMMSFELFCSLPIVLGFALASLLVPSSWLLDDAGVVYFMENLVLREPGDISKISEWLLKYIKAITGFAAIMSYFSLFANTDFTSLANSGDDFFVSFVIFLNVIFLLIAFPFIGGILYMLIAQITIENNLPVLKQKLFQRMNAMGIDTTPRQIRDVLDPKDRAPRELEKVWKKVKLPHNEKRNADSAAMNPAPQS